MDMWMRNVALASLAVILGVTLFAEKEEVTCWTPVHFTGQHNEYTDMVCKDKHERNAFNRSINNPRAHKNPVKCLLLLEAAIVVVSFLVLSTIKSQSIRSMRNGCMGYSITHLVAGVAWALTGAGTYLSLLVNPKPENFECEFEVKMLGREQKYTVQCQEEEEEFTKWSLKANGALCTIMMAASLIQLFTLCLIKPTEKEAAIENGDKTPIVAVMEAS